MSSPLAGLYLHSVNLHELEFQHSKRREKVEINILFYLNDQLALNENTIIYANEQSSINNDQINIEITPDLMDTGLITFNCHILCMQQQKVVSVGEKQLTLEKGELLSSQIAEHDNASLIIEFIRIA